MPIEVQTPMGEYNPDWAIVKEEDGQGRLYLVRETKGSDDGERPPRGPTSVPTGDITEAGLRWSIDVGIQCLGA